MKVVITDISALFDILKIGVLPEFFALEYEFCITDTVYNEISKIEDIQEFEIFVRMEKLKIIEISENDLAEIISFQWKFRNRSLNDKSNLWKALRLKAVVLTCDKRIKDEAEHWKLKVHGSIWVIQELEGKNLINTKKAIELLEQLKIVGDRLPIEKINKIIKRLKLKMD